MHAELIMNVTNEAPSSTHERRADWGGETSICLLSFGAGQRGFLASFSAMAEHERMRIVKRTQEGRRLAIEAGKRMGRKPKLTTHQQRSVRTRLARDIAKDFAVHHATIARQR